MKKWFKKIFSRKAQTSRADNPESWLLDAMGGGSTNSGAYVSEDAALRYVDVLSCVMLISKVVASLKPRVYKMRRSGGKDYAYDHYLNEIIQRRPNKEMVGFSYWESSQSNLLTWGNAYSEIARNRYTGRVVGLFPVHPGGVTMYRVKNGSSLPIGEEYEYRTGGIRYQWADEDGKVITRRAADVLHVPGYGGNALVGKSVIGLARELIGLGLAVEEFGARYFGAGTHPGAVVTHPKVLSEPAWKRLKLSLSEKYAGLGKSHRLLLLEDGMSFQSVSIPANDAQFIQTRQLNREQICSIYGVPPHMIAALEKASFNNIEVMDSSFVTKCIVPWLERYEAHTTVKLLTQDERQQGYEIIYDTENLLRGDFKTRMEGYQTGVYGGWFSRNEAREKEGLNPVDGLDTFLVPVNMMSADNLDNNATAGAVVALEGVDNEK